MPSNQSTYDQETEERRIRPRDPRPTYLQFIDDSFWALGEQVVLGFPSIGVLIIAVDLPFQTGGVLTFISTWLAITVFRGGWLPTGRPWPAVDIPRVLLRTVHYNAALFLAPYMGARAWIQTESTAILAAVTIVLSILFVGLTSWTNALLTRIGR